MYPLSSTCTMSMIEALLRKNITNWKPDSDFVLPIVSIREFAEIDRKHSILLKPSNDVDIPICDADKKALLSFVKQMISTMFLDGGIGLAAVQVNVNLNIFVIGVTQDDILYESYKNDPLDCSSNIVQTDRVGYYFYTKKPIVCINPKIVYFSEDLVVMSENCLSVRNNTSIDISRPKKVILHYIDQFGKKQILRASGLLSRCIQHEYDHLLGRIIDVI